MPLSPEIFEASIVALGDFNPPIFSPDWLERNKLIGSDDARVALTSENLVIARQVSRFETEWFAFQVISNQFSLASKGAVSPSLKDLAVGIFSLVSQTPITAVGLNFMAHYKMANEADYHAVGDFVVPKTIWEKLYPEETHSVGMKNATLVVHPCKRSERPSSNDQKQIAVQPSSRVQFGVYFSFNDHHEIKVTKDDKKTAAEKFVEIVNESWQGVWDESIRTFETVIEAALK